MTADRPNDAMSLALRPTSDDCVCSRCQLERWVRDPGQAFALSRRVPLPAPRR